MKRTINSPVVFELQTAKTICYVDSKIEVYKYKEDGEELVGEPLMLLNYGPKRLLQKSVDLESGEYHVYLRITATENTASGVFEFRFLVNSLGTYSGDGDVDDGPGFQRKGISKDFLLVVKASS